MADAFSLTNPKGEPKRKVILPPVTFAELVTRTGDVTDVIEERGAAWHSTGTPPNVLALDPGQHTGWCAIKSTGAFRVGTLVKDVGTLFASDWTKDFRAKLKIFGDEQFLVVVEDAFLHMDPRKRNPQAFASLNRRIGAVIEAASSVGMPSWRILASVWQRSFFPRCDREDGKAASRRACELRTGYAPPNDHESDAVLMALHARGPLASTLRKAAK